ncbi:calcineurin-like phosphoesterase family protein [Amycolatopsis sulphurea]|uniref:Calcineurin-like phosphoesterase family protein n=1 Tax=Amycolatopsis sulphurea TaxID=76022 RepID=A0A2A9FIE3_9PSEU|nr:phosphodiester glycosidase family protein [Amycolatopsis sulphurea]PFG50332.1 calcineurin-like phosphoesterase family protein [Amycolatopsis sulphurea]
MLLTAVLAVSVATPAQADPLAAPLGSPPMEGAPAASSAREAPVSAAAPAVDDGLVTSSSSTEVAPGLGLTQFDRFDPKGWIRGDTLSVDLTSKVLKPTYLSPGTVSARTPLSQQVAKAGAVVGVNGDFFDINATGAPIGVGIDNGKLQTAPAAGHNTTAAITEEGRAKLADIFLEASVTMPDGRVVPASNFNSPVLGKDALGVYTPLWGASARGTSVAGAQRVVEAEIHDSVVTQLRAKPADGPVPAGAILLLGREAGADALSALRVGDRVGVSYAPRTDAGKIAVAVGGNEALLKDGQLQPVNDTALAPRTAVGFSADGKRMWLITVDGRQADSRGMTELELARQMKSLGADDAINLDGGGSSTLLARGEGKATPTVRNSPSDGEERLVPNGIGVATVPGSGRLTGFAPAPAQQGENADRVLSGLTRVLTSNGHDETGAAVAANPGWHVSNPARGAVTKNVFTAHENDVRTDVDVTARQGRASGHTKLTVLGTPVRLGTSAKQVALSASGARGTFQVYGYDADGYGTWIEPSDVKLEYDTSVVKVVPSGSGFAVTALASSGATAITVHAAGLTEHLGASIGAVSQVASPLDGPDGWSASVYPAVVGAALSPAEGRDGGKGLALDYRLTGTTATRAAYVNATNPIPVSAGTQKIGLWVNGDGKGAWLRAELCDAANVASIVDLSLSVDWTGWRHVTATVPAGLPDGQRLTRFYAVENVPDQQYSGHLVFDDLTFEVAPTAQIPGDPAYHDPALVTDGTLGTGGLRIAVVSDAQFTADAPDGPLVAQARRAFREAVAAKPDLVLINGDLVDRGTAPDFALARKVIGEELDGRVPWYYVPGNHEAEGGDGLARFQEVFGPTHRVVDLHGIRLVLLDSSRGSLRAGGFDQVRMLRDALDSAAGDRSVRGVAVAMHHPVLDPSPAGNSQLTDRKEAALLQTWLTGFAEKSGKPAAAIASHAGVFALSRTDGVPYLVNGNSGKTPAAAPGDGGFVGWTLARLDPAGRAQPVRFETRPNVDTLTLTGPSTLPRAATARITATLAQGTRSIPVTYPVSAHWTGRAAHIGTWPPGPRDVVSFDPATGTVRALRPGTAWISVAVNGVSRTTAITVT